MEDFDQFMIPMPNTSQYQVLHPLSAYTTIGDIASYDSVLIPIVFGTLTDSEFYPKDFTMFFFTLAAFKTVYHDIIGCKFGWPDVFRQLRGDFVIEENIVAAIMIGAKRAVAVKWIDRMMNVDFCVCGGIFSLKLQDLMGKIVIHDPIAAAYGNTGFFLTSFTRKTHGQFEIHNVIKQVRRSGSNIRVDMSGRVFAFVTTVVDEKHYYIDLSVHIKYTYRQGARPYDNEAFENLVAEFVECNHRWAGPIIIIFTHAFSREDIPFAQCFTWSMLNSTTHSFV